MLLLHYLIVSLIFGVGLYHIFITVASLHSPHVFRKDFLQEYLISRAMLAGVSPYQPISDLAREFIGEMPVLVFGHPTPHPPAVALVALPLGFMSYAHAAVVWYLFEVSCIFAAIYIFLNCFYYSSSFAYLLVATALFISWNPVWEELVLGQLMSPLLLILMLAWRSLRKKQFVATGIFLGLAISLKIICWPIVIYFALVRRWSVVLSSSLVILATHGIAILFMGYTSVLFYYQEVGANVGALYKSCVMNFSLYGLAGKIFSGTGCSVLSGAEAPALIPVPWLSGIVGLLLPIAALIAGMTVSTHLRDCESSFALMVCVSLLVSPLFWTHYLILLSIPIYVLFFKLLNARFPRYETIFFVFFLVLVLVPQRSAYQLALFWGTYSYHPDNPLVSPGLLMFLTTLPLMAIIGFCGLILRLDRTNTTEF